MKDNKQYSQNGQVLIYIILFAAIAIYFISAMVSWTIANVKATRLQLNRELAIQIAEAGVGYYRWHLAHSPQDYQDGTGRPGPYTHDFRDKNGNVIGQFILDIVPPAIGSTLVTIKSTGKVRSDPNIRRIIVTKLAKPSLAKYAFIANATMRFGQGTEAFGPIHSNGGIRFDGVAHNLVTSAVPKYDDPDHLGPDEFGVHTHTNPVDPLPPDAVPTRTDVFRAGRQFPVPAVDFAGITSDIAQIRTTAQSSGFYRPASGTLGYHVVLRTNDTFDLYIVTGMISRPPGCASAQTGWGTWSVYRQTLIRNYPLPANGIMFFEDNVFVDGQINTARVTIVAALLPDNPTSRKNIIINKNLLYSNYDSRDVIGLIAQGNINIGMASVDNLRIDAALIAQNGRVGRHYYGSSCSPYNIRQSITLWGMIATNQRYGFAYTDGTGYQIRNINYDPNLLYSPPPNFPLTTQQYSILSWEEVK